MVSPKVVSCPSTLDRPGWCCENGCNERAAWAVTGADAVVHGVCEVHLAFPALVTFVPWAGQPALRAAG